MRKHYTAIGETRNLAPQLPELFGKIAAGLEGDNYVLRTNGENGTSHLFQKGVAGSAGASELHLPWSGFNSFTSMYTGMSERARSIGFSHVNKFGYLSNKKQQIICANIQSLLGEDCTDPSEFMITYMYDGNPQQYMLRIAHEYQVQIMDLTSLNPYKLASSLGVSI